MAVTGTEMQHLVDAVDLAIDRRHRQASRIGGLVLQEVSHLCDRRTIDAGLERPMLAAGQDGGADLTVEEERLGKAARSMKVMKRELVISSSEL